MPASMRITLDSGRLRLLLWSSVFGRRSIRQSIATMSGASYQHIPPTGVNIVSIYLPSCRQVGCRTRTETVKGKSRWVKS
eukprot:6181431-Pleurochrysis_carterae.AAC.2